MMQVDLPDPWRNRFYGVESRQLSEDLEGLKFSIVAKFDVLRNL